MRRPTLEEIIWALVILAILYFANAGLNFLANKTTKRCEMLAAHLQSENYVRIGNVCWIDKKEYYP